MFEQLIADAKAAYATGNVTPGRRRFLMDKQACLVAAAYLLHHNFERPGVGVKMGHWAMEHYNIPRTAAEGLLHGWDGATNLNTDELYKQGYQAGRQAAVEIG